jgi:hypothetical protein
MALMWSAAPPRSFMNDGCRGRYSSVPPKAENFPESRGPQYYSPRRLDLHNTLIGNVTLRFKEKGTTERDLTLSNGVDVRHLLPAGPGSYEPDDLWKRSRSPQDGLSPSSGSGLSPTKTPDGRRSPPRSPPLGGSGKLVSATVLRTGAEDLGPGSYDPMLPKTSQSGGTFSRLKRDSNLPLRRPKPLTREEVDTLPPVGCGKPGTSEPGIRGSPRRPPGKTVAVRGPTIPISPRKFNLTNPNSFTYRDRDADFNVPPPGWYNARDTVTSRSSLTLSRGGRFTSSPRRIDLSRRTAAPGPGTYYADDGTNPVRATFR